MERCSNHGFGGQIGFTGAIQEDYAQSPNDQRTVQYFDKSRMEITNPSGDKSSQWYVTNGLLVREMVDGYYQTGDVERDDSPDPANVNIAGDPGQHPTYADIGNANLQQSVAERHGYITATFDNGLVGSNLDVGSFGETYYIYVPETQHNVAGIFYSYFNGTGTIYQDGQYVDGRMFDPWFYASGYPITEPYWSQVAVGGTVTTVLWQCFERRCLTYTPENAPAWQVEMGNVGQHYYHWRYGSAPPTTPPSPPSPPVEQCDPSYPDFCIPSPPPTLTCDDEPIAGHTDFAVLPADPHNLDPDGNGIGCESATHQTFGDGTWVVGEDIQPGIYRNSDSSDLCYWERLSGFSGELDDIIANDIGSARMVVEIKSSDTGFSSDRCGEWTNDLSPITESPTSDFGEGMMIVGVDVAPGLWRNSDSSDSCYWERVSGFTGELDDIISNEFTDTIQTVQISSSDTGFDSHRCGTWTRIGG